MSANGLQIVTLEFPDPAVYPNAADYNERVNSSISFTYSTSDDVRTLSTNSASTGSDRVGFLYVPGLDEGDDCVNASAPYVPSNVTSFHDLPTNVQLVAIAPWLSPACTLRYLSSAQADLVSAFLFFLPNSTDGLPPAANDAAWGLGDGGQWKKNNAYPVYAIPYTDASVILDSLSKYSGNISSAPHASDLTRLYGDDNYVRLFIDIDLGSSSGIPSVWVFLLIILAILIAAVGFVSCGMHFMQRRRRRNLRRRIAAGQTDLEALGIKKLTVPQDMIDKMPVYPYGTSRQAQATQSVSVPHVDGSKNDAAFAGVVNEVPTDSPQELFQPTCAICLDDFVTSETNVRELPCRHIYHPECIDTFLRENSALCPMCKKSTLPKGYVPPQITNLMIRRERNLRRQHARNPASRGNGGSTSLSEHHDASTSEPPSSSIEMMDMEGEPSSPPPPATSGRREWARRRALAMLGPRTPAEEEDRTQPRSMPRKLLRTIFPGIG